MAMWFYQFNPDIWPPTRFRLDVWENERWRWQVGKGRITPADGKPEPGEIVVFFYTGGGPVGGFYGWAVILRWDDKIEDAGDPWMHFRPVAPSDRLKMCPWNDARAMDLAKQVRGGGTFVGTLWRVPDDLEAALRTGFVEWAAGRGAELAAPG